MKIAKFSFFILFLGINSYAQNQSNTTEKFKMSLVFGLNQPVITQGFNVELNYYTKYFVFDYSHGFNLHFKDKLVTEDARNQHLKFKISHSLGFGVGYRITPEFNLRIEPKLHIWNMYYDDKSYAKDNKIKQYSTYTLGLGAYYRWLPFRNQAGFAQGISVVPSVRWWPNVLSTLKDNEYTYFNRITNQNEVHKANNIGINNTPFFGNISVGYSFGNR